MCAHTKSKQKFYLWRTCNFELLVLFAHLSSMSVVSQLEALKQRYDNKNATLRILFEQRLDRLRNNILDFIGNALRDDTVSVLNESATTRAFVVDRILELVSDNLESEKETTIFNLITNVNELTKQCDALKMHNERLKQEQESLVQTQQTVSHQNEEFAKLKQSVADKEIKIKAQCDELKCMKDELQIKTHELERQQSQTDQQHEHIATLHEKLEHSLKNLQAQQTKFEQHCIENKQLKTVHEKNQSELKKTYKQIEALRTSLMKSESERLVLRKQYMDIGNKLESITKDLSQQRSRFEKERKEKKETMLMLQGKLQQVLNENESLKSKLYKQSHSLSKKMKQELGKTKVLCDDVAMLRQQLESERNISKMYVDELQKLKVELHEKDDKLSASSQHLSHSLSSQKKKMHKYYQKMVDANMLKLRDEYELHIKELKDEYMHSLKQIQQIEQEKHVQQQSELLLKLKETEEEHNKENRKFIELEQQIQESEQKLEEHKSKQEALAAKAANLQTENQKLRESLLSKDDEMKGVQENLREAKQSFQRILEEKQEEHQELTEVVDKLKEQNESMQQSKHQEESKATAVQSDLKQNIEELTQKIETLSQQNDTAKRKLERQRNASQSNERVSWKYQQKLTLIGELCRNIQREIKNNKKELQYVKTSSILYLDKLFQHIQKAFYDIQYKSADYGMKREFTKSMIQFKQDQESKLQSIQAKMKEIESQRSTLEFEIEPHRLPPTKALNISGLENEMDTIRDQLARAKKALSPRQIKFNKISLPSSLASSATHSLFFDANNGNEKKNMERNKTEKQEKSKNDRDLNESHQSKKLLQPQPKHLKQAHDAFATASIRKLRDDLQSLEANYQRTKKEIKTKYSGKSSADSSSLIE